MDKSNNIYKKIENTIKLVMVSTFFMPWVVTDVGGVIKKFHFIGWLVGGRTGSSEELRNYVINHSDSIFIKIISFMYFLGAIIIHFGAIRDELHKEKKHENIISRLIFDVMFQFVAIFGNVMVLLIEYPDYYNKINRPDHMQAYLGYGFWLYIILFVLSYIYGLLFKTEIQGEDKESDNSLDETIKQGEQKKWNKNLASAGKKSFDFIEGPATFDNINYDDRMYICLLLKEGDIDEAVEFYSKAGKVSKEEARNKIEDYKKMLFE